MDMPRPMQLWNIYRARALGNIWQREGIKVIPTLTWASADTYDFCFDGVPQGATVATSTVGIKNDKQATKVFTDGLNAALKAIKPKTLLLYGGRVKGVECGNTKVIDIKANTAFRKGVVK